MAFPSFIYLANWHRMKHFSNTGECQMRGFFYGAIEYSDAMKKEKCIARQLAQI